MAVKSKILTRETIIQNIKDAGQSLIDNAEKIVNEIECFMCLEITIDPGYIGEEPRISVGYEFIPENTVHRIFNNDYFIENEMTEDTHVYCTQCKNLHCYGENIECIYKERCDFTDIEDSKPLSKRPFYEKQNCSVRRDMEEILID